MVERYISDELIEQHLRETYGNLAMVAKRLGISRMTVHNHITANKHLQDVCAEARESVIDLAESTIKTAMDKGDVSAAKYILSTIGKNRGYVEKQDVSISGLDGINITCGLKPIDKENDED